MTSERFSTNLYDWLENGGSRISFVIGGADGLPSTIRFSKDPPLQTKISLSSLTFTHQFARTILMEQIYRAAEIRKGAYFIWFVLVIIQVMHVKDIFKGYIRPYDNYFVKVVDITFLHIYIYPNLFLCCVLPLFTKYDSLSFLLFQWSIFNLTTSIESGSGYHK